MEALMPPYIREVGEGNMSIEEYQEMMKQQQEQAQQQPRDQEKHRQTVAVT